MPRYPATLTMALWLSASLAASQSTPPEVEATPTEGIAGELARLNGTLERVAELLDRQTQGQRLELLLRQSSVFAESVGEARRFLHEGRAEREDLDGERRGLDSRTQQFAADIAAGAYDGSPETIEAFREHLENELDAWIERSRAVDVRLVLLENELARAQDDLADWQDLTERAFADLEAPDPR